MTGLGERHHNQFVFVCGAGRPAKGVPRQMKPIIGITPSPSEDAFSHGTFSRYAISNNYTEAVEAAGGVPVVLPPQASNLDEMLGILDGLLLSGGGDIRPERYGDPTVHPKTYGIHDLRDTFEIALVRAAIQRDMPLLCICRGIQVLNVALGGTLIQDVADQHGTQVEHRQQANDIPASEPSHEVVVVPGSLLERVYGITTIPTNSFHHQAVKDGSPELRAIATAPDGIVEGVERPESTWVLGVQWHPEMMFRAHAEHLQPFRALVDASSRTAGHSRERAAAD